MSDKCSCPLHGLCSRRGMYVNKHQHRLCLQGKVTQLDEMFERLKNPPPARVVVPSKSNSCVGDYLHAIIKRETGEEPCEDCVNEIKALNRKTVKQVLNEIEDTAHRIVLRAAAKSQKWYYRLVASYAPSMAKPFVIEWIQEACWRVENNDPPKE